MCLTLVYFVFCVHDNNTGTFVCFFHIEFFVSFLKFVVFAFFWWLVVFFAVTVNINVTQYQPSVPSLKNILMKHWQLIENQTLLGQIYKEPPIIWYKWGRSLKDILIKAKVRELKAINTWVESVSQACQPLGLSFKNNYFVLLTDSIKHFGFFLSILIVPNDHMRKVKIKS